MRTTWCVPPAAHARLRVPRALRASVRSAAAREHAAEREPRGRAAARSPRAHTPATRRRAPRDATLLAPTVRTHQVDEGAVGQDFLRVRRRRRPRAGARSASVPGGRAAPNGPIRQPTDAQLLEQRPGNLRPARRHEDRVVRRVGAGAPACRPRGARRRCRPPTRRARCAPARRDAECARSRSTRLARCDRIAAW